MQKAIKKSNLQILKIMLSTITGNFGSLVLSFVIGLLILKNTNSILGFGFSQIIGPLVSILLLPFLGSIVDKYDRKKIIIASQILSIITLSIYALLITISKENTIIYTYILLTILRISDEFLSISFMSSQINLVLEEDIQKLNSLKGAINSLMSILSPIIAGLLLSKFLLIHFVLMEIVIEFITFIIVLFIDFKFNKVENEETRKDENIIKMFKDSLNYLKGQNLITFLITLAMIVNFMFTSISLALPIIQIKYLKFEDFLYAITTMAFSLGIFLSSIVLSTIKTIKNPIKTAVFGVLNLGVLLSLFGVSLIFSFSKMTYFYIIIIFLLAMSTIASFINIPLQTLFVKTIEEKYQGRVFNLIETLCQLLNPLGILIFSILFENFKIGIIFIICSFLIIFSSIVFPKIFKINLKNIKN